MYQPLRTHDAVWSIFTALAAAIIGTALPGCSGTDAFISALYNLKEDNGALFATHADETAWLFESGQLIKFGRLPIAASASGKVVVAMDLRTPSAISLRTSTSGTRTVDIRKNVSIKELRLAELRCNDDSILAKLVGSDGKSNPKWVHLRVGDLVQSDATIREWMAMKESNPVVARQERHGDVTLNIYQLNDGSSIVNRLETRESSTINYVEADGTVRQLLRESSGKNLARRFASWGAQYP